MSSRKTDGNSHNMRESTETSLLGCLLLHPEKLADIVATGLTPEHFSAGKAGSIVYETILKMDGVVEIDTVSVANALVARELIEKAGGHEFLIECVESENHGHHAVTHARAVIDYGEQYHAKQIGIQIVNQAGDLSGAELREMLRRGLDHLGTTECRIQPPFVTSLIDMADFCEMDLARDWLIEGVLVRGEEMIVGGPDKSLKTSVVVDAVVSLAAGTYFLDCRDFRVTAPVRTCLMTCESGDKTIQDTVRRVARAKQVHVDDLRGMLFYGPDLPIIANDWHMAALKAYIDQNDIKCVVIDPAYLCLYDETTRVQSSDILQMGPLLLRLTDIRRETGVTIILIHHTRKNEPKFQSFHKTTRQDLAQSGFAAYMRQWLLLSRRREYQHDGRHEMHLEVGGSAGHSSEYVMEADEGKQGNDLTDWGVTLTPAREFEEAAKAGKEERADAKRGETQTANDREDRRKVLDVMRREAYCRPDGPGLVKSAIARLGHIPNGDATAALLELKGDGKVEQVDPSKGRSPWRLACTDTCTGETNWRTSPVR